MSKRKRKRGLSQAPEGFSRRVLLAVVLGTDGLIVLVLMFILASVGRLVQRDLGNGLLIAGGIVLVLAMAIVIGTAQDPRISAFYQPPTTRDNISEVSRQINQNTREGRAFAGFILMAAVPLLLLGLLLVTTSDG
jgi:hypothetical protein